MHLQLLIVYQSFANLPHHLYQVAHTVAIVTNYFQTSQLSRFHPVSHGFTYCISHGFTVASSFLTVLQFFSGFFFRLRKQAKAVQFLVKKYRSMVIFVILDIETTTRSSPGVSVPGDYFKHQSCIKVAFFMDSFCNHLEIFQNGY